MADIKRILILTADVGFGHRVAANAVAAGLQELAGEGVMTIIANPLDDERVPGVLHDSQTDYDRLVREMPEIYRLRYTIGDAPLPNAIVKSYVTIALYTVVRDLIRQHQPDAIVITHPMFPGPVSAVLTVGKYNLPFYTVVTDLANVHRMWFDDSAQITFLPTEDAFQQALENGFAPESLLVTGIPIDPDLARPSQSKLDLRLSLGWLPDLTTALVVGSRRVKGLWNVLHILNHSGLPLQLIIIAGGDDRLYRRLKGEEWHCPVQLHNYVQDMGPFLHSADLVVGKAGGLIITESLACGLPLLLVDVTPGQEEGNADYVVRHGAAERAITPAAAQETLFHWLMQGGELLNKRAEAACRLGRSQAALQIARVVYAATQSNGAER